MTIRQMLMFEPSNDLVIIKDDLTLFTLLVADPFGHLFPWIHRGERAQRRTNTLPRTHETDTEISVLKAP